jgi:FMN-dependent oxidoreductase (nitrilotriacetate monooxygenase family)
VNSRSAQDQRELHLGLVIIAVGNHDAAWLSGECDPFGYIDPGYFKNLAEVAERGTFDALFFPDIPAAGGGGVQVAGHDPGAGAFPWQALDPALILASVIEHTSHIGLISSASTTFNEPYDIARRFASLDHLSGGRAGWNIVATFREAAARNFGLEMLPTTEERYERATEFVEVVTKLWDSWEDGALLADRARGYFADYMKIHPIRHSGEHFSVAGPLQVPRSPQGHPVLAQAGSSPAGRELAARYGDLLFTAQGSLEGAAAFADDIRDRASRIGRDPAEIRFMPGLETVIGGTEEEAWERKRRLDDFLGEERLLTLLAGMLGVDPEHLRLDEPLSPYVLDRTREIPGARGPMDAVIDAAERERLTARELFDKIGNWNRYAIGAPEQIADFIEQWFRSGAIDGFNIMPDVLPSGLEAFVEQVVPILRRRGLLRHEYTGSTLRDHLGLPRLPSRYASPSGAAA